ncbi:hypothetical protein F5884DRAFT_663284 [Xylogone sp. PMI_703]|nr:hypothetical protein F5884DRAFT_663284 [Xylogone sp. PMI_703]
MAALSPAASNRLLLVGFGLTTFAVLGFMRYLLVENREAAKIKPPQNKPQYITQDVEDSLKLETLNKLLDSPNYGIQETTAIIICERALHDGVTIDTLLWYITRPDHEMRETGIRALTMLMNSSMISMINKPKTYAALVKSLEYSITDYKHNVYDPEWDNWYLRDVVEQGCLLVLGQLVEKCGVDGLVKARFVDRWLVKEPWSSSGSAEEIRHNFSESLVKNNRLNQITIPLADDEAGRRQLERAGLLRPEPIEDEEDMKDTEMIHEEGSLAAEDESVENLVARNNRRPRDQSREEEHLRRRHREAMVLNDGTRPLGRSDIIQRER